MSKENKIRIIGISVVAFLWLVAAVFCWVLPNKAVSESERRQLAQMPELNVETLFNGQFTSKFETYTLDQFPARDFMRTVKSFFHYYVMNQSDNNDIYIKNGYAAKMEYPLNESSLDYANKRFDNIYNLYLKDSNTQVYLSVIPDKNFYLSNGSKYLQMDYSALFEKMKTENEWATYIPIATQLSYDHFYKTDTHWKQENILPVAAQIYAAMNPNATYNADFVHMAIDEPFYGVYYGQAALPLDPDKITILTNETIESCVVLDYETNKEMKVYEESSLLSDDKYDIYLSGAKALLKITNPNATSDKELVIFRDSFGSSITPLLIQDYKTITLVDIRYIKSEAIGSFIKFDNQDVLFLYSTLVLNSSSTFK